MVRTAKSAPYLGNVGFDQHVIEDAELGYLAIDEGDYDNLTQTLIDRIVYTAPGGILDEF